MSRTSTFTKILAFSVMCVIWSSTWSIIKVGLRGAPPLTAVAVRFFIAAMVVLVIVALARVKIPRERSFLALGAFLALTQMSGGYGLVYWGEQRISSSLAAILFSTLPLMVAILARIFLGNPLTRSKIIGIITGVAGVWTIFGDRVSLGEGAGAGIMAILLSVFFAATASIVIKKYAGRFHPMAALIYPFLLASIIVGTVAAPLERSNPFHYGAVTWATIIYLAVFGSVVAFTLFFWIVKRVDVTVVSYQTFIIPILAVIIGWLFLGETISPRTGVGAAFIIAGICVATIPRMRARTPVND